MIRLYPLLMHCMVINQVRVLVSALSDVLIIARVIQLLNKMKNPPSKEHLLMDRALVDLINGTYIQTLSDKCSCPSNKGTWVVEWDQRFYPFVHANNLQKDIWLGGAKTESAKEKRLEMLRWYCYCCHNVQMP